ncbi:ureidoglycolate lyase [Microvirga lotononidis]|uniref:Ureidoglycolate hydrolase n=1 Tax=Microvirga lotononidis TaxID=864069 RepID=I4YKI6_9HYPH|nr:ureidoglycolate lyase [Microvirga lotononidis]EIM24478.1 ureidoglycolate hydrolase [Microvirga lotononidis]WQO26504.1 ureidoglycolate lyase [Microvirga lotononidis]
MQTLFPKRLTPSAFSSFGEVLFFDPGRSRLVNDGRALRFDTDTRFDHAATEGEPVLAVYRASGWPLPMHLLTFERHPLSSQTFMALSAERFLIVVAPEDPAGLPDLERAEAFVGHRNEGVNYARNLWHAPIAAVGADGDFLMFMWERGSSEDCVFHHLDEPLVVGSIQPFTE